ncbi:NPP1 family protein [Streptomyces sp. HNM0663]|uniref:NPP1 family protein n=1 Tax=Streptomyces chengmaiensis TaxID=3040919 RepID=A0ABT6HUU7_9ACTN|nr:NPP1 family protein [Streptomyces chengmaiensis]MDH2392155.1 NPP1 family protein [Streptomyces chengmaiensis]
MAAVLIPAVPVAAAGPEPPPALPESATAADPKRQPALDYDRDGCCNVPAIGPDGQIAEGLVHNNTSGSAHCGDQSDLDNAIVELGFNDIGWLGAPTPVWSTP